VASEVARTYIELRGSQQQVAVAERNAVSQSETVRLTQSQFDAGQVTELDVARARSELALTQATIPPLRSAVEQSAFRLGVLLGREPAALLTELLQPQPIPLYRVAVGLDEPSIMLRRRPEVLRAEEELKAAVAQIGVELGEYFPKLEILGSLSIEGDSWGALRNDPTRVFSVGPRLTWRGLDGGRVSNRVAGARADADGAEARYRSAVLMALEEVEAGLSRYGSERTRVQHLKVALEQSQRSVTLAKRQYEAGAIDLLSVLDSERRMLEAEDSLARGETQAMVSLVATIKALGVPVISEDARPS
jgi:multidrug efflux system outer membrane protein